MAMTQAEFDKKVLAHINDEYLYAKKFADGYRGFEVDGMGEHTGTVVHFRAFEVEAWIYVEFQSPADSKWRYYGRIDIEQ
jgi:hypothetical protein